MKRVKPLQHQPANPSGAARRMVFGWVLLGLAASCLAGQGPVPRWQIFEQTFESSSAYTNPVQQASLTATFKSPRGDTHTVPGFWDGARTWRVRFSPNQPGKWTYQTTCSDQGNTGLHDRRGDFDCGPPLDGTELQRHGPIRISPDERSLVHEDQTNFFYLADTAWNGPLLSSAEDWNTYLKERRRQKFTAVQWVTTQWRAAPKGDREQQLAYAGKEIIEINPKFFQRLDEKVQAMNDAGLVSVPVLLWAFGGGSQPEVNPGFSLPEDQAILLARYMVARWGAHQVIWILGGDGDYRQTKADRWKRIGRAVFGDISHDLVTMHPGGMQWVWNEFKDEKWYGFLGYQSGHGDDDATLQWLIQGPLTDDWTKLPHRPFINLEPPYENHISYHSKSPITPETMRRAIYWSLLDAPTAGTAYGGHGVWGWDDGTQPPTDHAGSGTPLPWQKALTMPGAEQMAHLYTFFTSIDFWRLRPTPMVLAEQPGQNQPQRYAAAARSDKKDLLVVYTPEDRTLVIKLDELPPSPSVTWINPRTGEKNPAVGVVTANTCQFPTPTPGDWILFMETEKEKPAGETAEGDAPKEEKPQDK